MTVECPFAPNCSPTEQTLITALHVVCLQDLPTTKQKTTTNIFHCFYKALMLFIGCLLVTMRQRETEKTQRKLTEFENDVHVEIIILDSCFWCHS